jgi:hypothetical protein
MTNGQRGSGSSFFEEWGNARKYRRVETGWRARKPLALQEHFVAHPTGYPWRVPLQDVPLPFHRLRESVMGRIRGVKKKV